MHSFNLRWNLSVNVSKAPCRLQHYSLSQRGLIFKTLAFLLWGKNVFMTERLKTSLQNLSTAQDGVSWQVSDGCKSCSLNLRENFIYSTKDSLYFFYAYVTFREVDTKNQKRSVTLIRNASPGKQMKILVEGSSHNTLEDSVWVARIVSFKDKDSISLNITGDFLRDSRSTFWGAFQLH